MNIFETLEAYRYENIHFFYDRKSKMKAIISLHSTKYGPGLGGVRVLHYETDNHAITDALKLSRAMTYKSAIAKLDLGGGKAVISLPKGEFNREEIFTAFGKAVDSLGGQYYTTEDSGSTPKDMETIREQTKYVCGFSTELGGSGDPSPLTARGVLRSIEATAHTILKRSDLSGLKVAIQGVGNVGFHLAKMLADQGAELVVADINKHRVEKAADELKAATSSLDSILFEKCDILAPCALGGAITGEVAKKLNCKAVVGAANNQLADYSAGKELWQRQIFYGPDYLVNGGGLIHVAQEVLKYDQATVNQKTDQIYDTTKELIERSRKENVRPEILSDTIAEERLKHLRS